MMCSCGPITLDAPMIEGQNWNPDCDEHGIGADWWTEEGRSYLAAIGDRASEMQARARDAIRKVLMPKEKKIAQKNAAVESALQKRLFP